LQAEKNKTLDDRINVLKEMSDIQNETIIKFSDNLNERIKALEYPRYTMHKEIKGHD